MNVQVLSSFGITNRLSHDYHSLNIFDINHCPITCSRTWMGCDCAQAQSRTGLKNLALSYMYDGNSSSLINLLPGINWFTITWYEKWMYAVSHHVTMWTLEYQSAEQNRTTSHWHPKPRRGLSHPLERHVWKWVTPQEINMTMEDWPFRRCTVCMSY